MTPTTARTKRATAAVLLLAFATSLSGQARSAGLVARVQPPGAMVDVGGRRLRLVCAGPAQGPRPTVLLESGAFGFSGDWAWVQRGLTAQGVRSCAYDRAGLGLSDPSPAPPDGVTAARDLETLLVKARVPPPYVLVGHSMAGARVHLFAKRNPDKIAGLVLVDSTPPEALDDPLVRAYVDDFRRETRLAAIVGSTGALRLLVGTPLADKIGLPPEQDREKRRQFGSGAYNRAAYAEVVLWPRLAAEARQAGPLDPRWPVAVITAGAHPGDIGAALAAVQARPALASQHGHVDVVPSATHNGLLGARFAGSIVKGIDFVLEAAAPPGNG